MIQATTRDAHADFVVFRHFPMLVVYYQHGTSTVCGTERQNQCSVRTPIHLASTWLAPCHDRLTLHVSKPTNSTQPNSTQPNPTQLLNTFTPLFSASHKFVQHLHTHTVSTPHSSTQQSSRTFSALPTHLLSTSHSSKHMTSSTQNKPSHATMHTSRSQLDPLMPPCTTTEPSGPPHATMCKRICTTGQSDPLTPPCACACAQPQQPLLALRA